MSFALLFLLFVYREIFQVNSQTAQRARFQQFAHASRREIYDPHVATLRELLSGGSNDPESWVEEIMKPGSFEGAYVIKEMRVFLRDVYRANPKVLHDLEAIFEHYHWLPSDDSKCNKDAANNFQLPDDPPELSQKTLEIPTKDFVHGASMYVFLRTYVLCSNGTVYRGSESYRSVC